MVFTRLVAQGIVIVSRLRAAKNTDVSRLSLTRSWPLASPQSVSNGNSGDSGLWYTAAPAIARGVIAVSSIQKWVLLALRDATKKRC